jgi:predicted metal-dependent hydrolase
MDEPATEFGRTGAMDEVDPRLSEAVALFNDREFFACHDVLEEVWSETLEGREFYQGLIHAAVALFHFSEGNLGGARKMAVSAVRYLQPFRPECRGVDVERLIEDFQLCFAELLRPHEAYPVGLQLDDERIPVIQLRDA